MVGMSSSSGSSHSKRPGQAVDVGPEWGREEARTPLEFGEQKSLS